MRRSGTPLASASSGCRLAKSSGRMMSGQRGEREMPSTARARWSRDRPPARCRRAAPSPASQWWCSSAGTGGRSRATAPARRRWRRRDAEALAEQPHGDAGGEREAEQAPQRREPEQRGAGRPGKADVRERVAGEGLPAQHQEIADQAGDHRDDAGGREGAEHEIVVKHVVMMPCRAMFVVVRMVAARRRGRATSRRCGRRRAAPRSRRHRAATAPAGDDLVDGAERRLAMAEIEHAVDRAEKLVQLVGAEQHRQLELATDSRMTSMATCCWCGSRPISGSSSRSSVGAPISACASRSRCRSPPDMSESGRRARSRAPTGRALRSCGDRRGQRRQAEAVAVERAGEEIESAHAKAGRTVRTCGR